MKVGDKLRITKKGNPRNEFRTNNRTAILEHIDKSKLTVMYAKNDIKYYNESFSVADVITGTALIDIKESNNWRRVTREDFNI